MPYVVTGIAACVLGVLCLVNRRIGGSFAYPPTVFSGWWALLLGAVAVSGDSFYPLSTITLCIYLIGPLFFALGGLLVINRKPTIPVRCVAIEESSSVPSKVVVMGIVILSAALPTYYAYIARISASSGSRDFWYGVRAAMVRRGERTAFDLRASLLDNLVTLSILILFIAWLSLLQRRRASRLQLGLAFMLALVYNLMRASSSAIALSLPTLIGMRWVRTGRIGRTSLILLTIVFLIAFSAVSILLSKGGANARLPLADNLPALVELIPTYTLGGVVGFDRVAVNPNSIPPTWDILRFFKLNANRLGASFSVPRLHAAYTMTSRNRITNVYTIYFAYYPEYGLLGVAVIMALLGAVVSKIYLRARAGGAQATIFYGLMFSGLILSGFLECFFLNLDFLLKCFVFTFLVYRLPNLLRGGARNAASGLQWGTPPPEPACMDNQ
jgi:oligosaccharide repeat unit polymerase